MNDTAEKFRILVERHHARLSPVERLQIAADMYDAARRLVLSSLPPELSEADRHLHYARRMYGDELPQAAYEAFASWHEREARARRDAQNREKE